MMPSAKTLLSTGGLLQLLLLIAISSDNKNKNKFLVSAIEEAEGQSHASYSSGRQPKLYNPLEDLEEEDDEDENEDENAYDDDEYEEGEEPKNLNFVSFGKPQFSNFGDADMVKKIDAVLEKTTNYMKEEVYVDPKYEFIRYRCRNFEHMCTIRAAEGYCENKEHRETMIKRCSPSCGTCDLLEEKYYADEKSRQKEFTLVNDDDMEPPSMAMGLQKEIVWGIAQNLGTTEEVQQKVYKVLNSTWDYMWDEVIFDDSDLPMHCMDNHKDCSIWSTMGLCETNPGYMQLYCAPACHTCNKVYADKRCPIDPDAPTVLSKPGDLNAVFERMMTDRYWERNHGPVAALSSPAMRGAPWVVTLDNFLTDEECNRFIEYGIAQGFKPSMEQGAVLFDGTSESLLSEEQTSAETECTRECAEDPVLKPVHERVERLTGFPQDNWEWLEMLRYEVGEEYKLHTDYIPDEEDFPTGPIVLSVYFFLNDVEAGGELFMDLLGVEINIKPKKGMAVVWPSVLDEDPFEEDERMYHAGLPVEAGVKYGVKTLIHNRNYKEQLEKKCVYVDGADSSILSPLDE